MDTEHNNSIEYEKFIESNDKFDIIVKIKYFKKQKKYDELIIYIIDFINNIIINKTQKYNTETFLVYIDIKDYKMKEIDYNFIKYIISFLEEKFSTNLDKIFIINYNLFIKGLFRIIKSFIHKDTCKKIFFSKKIKNI